MGREGFCSSVTGFEGYQDGCYEVNLAEEIGDAEDTHAQEEGVNRAAGSTIFNHFGRGAEGEDVVVEERYHGGVFEEFVGFLGEEKKGGVEPGRGYAGHYYVEYEEGEERVPDVRVEAEVGTQKQEARDDVEDVRPSVVELGD